MPSQERGSLAALDTLSANFQALDAVVGHMARVLMGNNLGAGLDITHLYSFGGLVNLCNSLCEISLGDKELVLEIKEKMTVASQLEQERNARIRSILATEDELSPTTLRLKATITPINGLKLRAEKVEESDIKALADQMKSLAEELKALSRRIPSLP